MIYPSPYLGPPGFLHLLAERGFLHACKVPQSIDWPSFFFALSPKLNSNLHKFTIYCPLARVATLHILQQNFQTVLKRLPEYRIIDYPADEIECSQFFNALDLRFAGFYLSRMVMLVRIYHEEEISLGTLRI